MKCKDEDEELRSEENSSLDHAGCFSKKLDVKPDLKDSN